MPLRFALSCLAALLLCVSLAPSPARAFDCAKADDAVSKAICADPALKAADDAMGKAYADLRQVLDSAKADILRAQQRGWLKQRDGLCGGWAGTPVDPACLLAETQARERALRGTPDHAAPGAPVFLAAVEGRLDKAAKVEATLLFPQSPDLPALDAAISGIAVGDGGWRSGEGFLAYDVTYRIPYASADLVSVVLRLYVDGGGAHPNSALAAVTWLVTDNHALQATDFVAPDRLKAATAFCKDAIAAIKRAHGEDESEDSFLTDEAVAANLKDAGNWWITPDGANVHYNAYDVGAYAEGTFDCAIPWATLKGFAPKNAPLPFPP